MSLKLPIEESSVSNEDVKKGIWNLGDLDFCGPIPPHTPYGVSFFLPNWDDLVQIMDENFEVIDQIKYGYTRVFIHEFLKQLNRKVLTSLRLGDPHICYTFPSSRVVKEFSEYLIRHAETSEQEKSAKMVITDRYRVCPTPNSHFKEILVDYAVFDKCLVPLAQAFWSNSGENISSRFAAHCLRISSNEDVNNDTIKSEERFRKDKRQKDSAKAGLEYEVYLEECLGAGQAIELEAFYKNTIKARIATGLAAGETECIPQHSDVYLFPTGMSAIYNTLRLALSSFEPAKSVCFGFPYKDTKKVLSQFGPGCIFYGVGESEDLAELEKLLKKEKTLLLICEIPTNPLLKSPDLHALRALADIHGFLLVVDDTLGNFINLQGLLIADVIVTSLTKIFSGFSDLLAGSVTLSPRSKFYQLLKSNMERVYEDYFWCEDAMVLERNSRTVVERACKANRNAEMLAEFLKTQPLVKQIHYPKFTTTELYNKFKKPGGGYGSLLSIEFHSNEKAVQFYDALNVVKGVSLGTNFTLALPFVILGHYKELDVVSKKYGVASHIVRVAVGLEGFDALKDVFQAAFDFAETKVCTN